MRFLLLTVILFQVIVNDLRSEQNNQDWRSITSENTVSLQQDTIPISDLIQKSTTVIVFYKTVSCTACMNQLGSFFNSYDSSLLNIIVLMDVHASTMNRRAVINRWQNTFPNNALFVFDIRSLQDREGNLTQKFKNFNFPFIILIADENIKVINYNILFDEMGMLSQSFEKKFWNLINNQNK